MPVVLTTAHYGIGYMADAQPLRDQPCTAAHTQQSGFTLLHAWTSRRLSINFAFEEQCAVRARKEAKTQARPIPFVPTLRVMECCRYVIRLCRLSRTR